MNELDLSAIYARYERTDGRGLTAYHPVLMARLLLYGYCIGITSSRKIEQATYDNVAFRYLSSDQHPDHDTLAAFRQEHVEALAELFVQALRLCQKAGLVKLGNVSIDGTKMKANASTRRSVRYERFSEREQHWRAEVARLLRQAQQTDREEERRLGLDQMANQLPDALANAQKRFERLQQAKAELEQEAQAQLKPHWTAILRANVVPVEKRNRQASRLRIADSARRIRSSVCERERTPSRPAGNITSSILTHE